MTTPKMFQKKSLGQLLNTSSKSSPTDDINILLLGETGVGKSTFINSFVNYLCYNKLETALSNEMQVLIPASFFVTDADTFESTIINLGTANKNEILSEKGESNTQGCQSYVFPIGKQKLRLIDAPGVGDTRGVTQDAKNFDHILKFISRYNHLNGICILLKPNEQRINVLFRFCIKELLTHLHVNAKNNIIFVFTNARSTFYLPGTTAPLLKGLLKELRDNTGVDVPFTKDNTFSFDNESFRFLATHKHGLKFTQQQTQDFSKSWDVSVTEFACLVSRIVTCKPHIVRDTVSLNEAQQLIRKLTRPIGEITTLIQENIQLAQRHKQDLLSKPPIIPARMPQKTATIVFLDHPRTVCTSEQCTRVAIVDGEQKVDYMRHCHPHCHLKGVEQEIINNPILQHCAAMNKLTGICEKCNCHWNKHMHITYEYRKRLHFLEMKRGIPQNHSFQNHSSTSASAENQSAFDFVEKRIKDLKEEETAILHVCTKLSQFLQANAITPFNDDILEYIRYFIREEKLKQKAGANNDEVIRGLENIITEYTREMDLFKKLIGDKTVTATNLGNTTQLLSIDGVFELAETLYALPINGQQIREQVDGLRHKQTETTRQREVDIQLPTCAFSSTVMKKLQEVVNQSQQ